MSTDDIGSRLIEPKANGKGKTYRGVPANCNQSQPSSDRADGSILALFECATELRSDGGKKLGIEGTEISSLLTRPHCDSLKGTVLQVQLEEQLHK